MLLDQINADLKAAMIARDETRKTTLQGLKSSIKYVEIDKKEILDDPAIMQVLQKEAKKRKESIVLYEQGGNTESAAKEQAELAIIEAYLPEMASEADIAKAVDLAIAETGASSMADMGAVMGKVKASLGDNVDGATVARLVKERLSWKISYQTAGDS